MNQESKLVKMYGNSNTYNKKIKMIVINDTHNCLNEDNFNDLIDKYDIKLFADEKTTKQELIEVLNEIYPIENQIKHGVVGIKIEII